MYFLTRLEESKLEFQLNCRVFIGHKELVEEAVFIWLTGRDDRIGVIDSQEVIRG